MDFNYASMIVCAKGARVHSMAGETWLQKKNCQFNGKSIKSGTSMTTHGGINDNKKKSRMKVR